MMLAGATSYALPLTMFVLDKANNNEHCSGICVYVVFGHVTKSLKNMIILVGAIASISIKALTNHSPTHHFVV